MNKFFDFIKNLVKQINLANAKRKVIENERKKMADAEAKIVVSEEALKD